MKMDEQNSRFGIPEYSISDDGDNLLRGRSDSDEGPVKVPNIMLCSHTWDTGEIRKYMAACIREAKDSSELKIADEETLAEFLTLTFIYTEQTLTDKDNDSMWLCFIRNCRRFATDPIHMVKKMESAFTNEDMKHWTDDLRGRKWNIKSIRSVLPFAYVQFDAIRAIPSVVIASVSVSEKAVFWMDALIQSAVCLNTLENWLREAMMSAAIDKETEDEQKKLISTCREFLKKWNPEKIRDYLDEYISGQDTAKTEFAHICYEHVARIANLDLEIKKSNYVMFGPTGCGKTELCRVIQKILPVPVEIIDSSIITSNGFRGPDKEDVMFELADSVPDIEYGIIVMDEFDKLCMPSFESNGGNVHRQIQGELLKMIEGTKLYRFMQNRNSELDTSNITFICAGAFTGAFDKEIKKGFGFGSSDEDLNSGKSITDCLEDYGMIPELAGRICSAIPLRQLGEDDFYEILTGKKDNCIDNIRKLYKAAYDTELDFSEQALREISRQAVKNGLGARGLSGIVENVCHINRKKITGKKKHILKITEDMVRSGTA